MPTPARINPSKIPATMQNHKAGFDLPDCSSCSLTICMARSRKDA
jgi:hypothetical protein